jgi:hypothetical protein
VRTRGPAVFDIAAGGACLGVLALCALSAGAGAVAKFGRGLTADLLENQIVATIFLALFGFFAWLIVGGVLRRLRDRGARRTTLYAITDRRVLLVDAAVGEGDAGLGEPAVPDREVSVGLGELAPGDSACEVRAGYVLLRRRDGTYALTLEGVAAEEGPIRDALARARPPA